MNTRVRDAAALRAWAVRVIPLAGPRATVETLTAASGVTTLQMRRALRTLVAEGAVTTQLQALADAEGVRRAVVYTVVAR